MLLVIHNLPFNSKYADVKALIQSKCGVTEVILDNLVNEGQTKKVTVGLADEGDGAILVRKINGIFVGGQQLYVEDLKQKKESEQPYRTSKSLLAEPVMYEKSNYNEYSQSGYQRDNPQPNQGFLQKPANQVYQNPDMNNMMMNMAAIGGMYYMPNMPQPLNSYLGYGGGQMEMTPMMPQVPEVRPLDRPFGFGDRPEENIHRDRQRPSFDRREPSPSRGGRDRDSRYEGRSEARSNSRRRSPSPRRPQWDSRDRSDIQKPYESYEENLRSRDRNELQTYDSAWGQVLQPMYENQFIQPDQNQFIQPDQNQFVRPDQNQFVRPDQNQFVRPDQNQFVRPDQNQFVRPDQNQFVRPDQNQFVRPDSNMRGGNDYARPYYQTSSSDYQNPHSDYSVRDPPREYRPLESRNSRGGPGSSRPSDNRRDESRFPPKRGNNKWNDDGPQAKRFAQSKDTPRGPNASRGPPNAGPRGPSNAGPRGPSNVGPRGSSNTQNRPGNPNVGKTGPANAANRFGQSNSGPKAVASNDNQKNTPETLEKLLNRDETWRGQAVASLANELLKNIKVELPAGDKIVRHLKQSIRARINVMLGDKISNRPEAIMEMYHQKFPPSGDQKFFSSVVNDLAEIRAKEAEEAAKNPPAEGSGPVKPKPVVPIKVPKSGLLQTPKPPVVPGRGPPKGQGSTKVLPKFPAADKKEYKKIKADQKKAWKDEDSLPSLPENLQKAIDEELNVLSDIFMNSCTPDCQEEAKLCEEISDVVSDEFRKVIRVHLKKRLANDNSHLVVRIFGKIKSQNKPHVEGFLAKHGCIALHQSDKESSMHLAHFNSYESYDRILKMGQATINQLPYSFKSFELCGPPPSATERRHFNIEKRKKFIDSQIDKSNINILQPGYVYEHPKQVVYTIHPKQQDTTAESEANDVQEIVDLPTEAQEDCEAIPIDDEADDIADENVDEDDLEDW